MILRIDDVLASKSKSGHGGKNPMAYGMEWKYLNRKNISFNYGVRFV
jgi:hypothetical protein